MNFFTSPNADSSVVILESMNNEDKVLLCVVNCSYLTDDDAHGWEITCLVEGLGGNDRGQEDMLRMRGWRRVLGGLCDASTAISLEVSTSFAAPPALLCTYMAGISCWILIISFQQGTNKKIIYEPTLS